MKKISDIVSVVEGVKFTDPLLKYQDMLIDALESPNIDGDYVSVLVHSLNHPEINMAIFGVERLA